MTNIKKLGWKKVERYGWVKTEQTRGKTSHLWVGNNNNLYYSSFTEKLVGQGSGQRIGYLWADLKAKTNLIKEFTTVKEALKFAINYMRCNNGKRSN